MRTFVLGDIHGGHRALAQCFERCGFNLAADRLIFLGDATDGWPESPQVLEHLLQVRDLVYILGNHDVWLMEWLAAGWESNVWLSQGGQATVDAYSRPQWQERRGEHLELLRSAAACYIDDGNRLFVHGGIDRRLPLEEQNRSYVTCDRNVFHSTSGVWNFDSVYIGHTPTVSLDRSKPLNFGGPDNVWRLDTGAGWNGRLSIMEVGTRKYWQSDLVSELYPGERGRQSLGSSFSFHP